MNVRVRFSQIKRMNKAKPNILYVFADQWPAHVLGYAGNPDVRTPNLDALAAESIHCPVAIANNPVCTPSRATLLTGQLPDRHGLFLNDAPLDPKIKTMGEYFSSLGYATAYIGKWHVDGHGRSCYIPPERQHGFAYWKALECTHSYHQSRYYAGDDPTPKTWESYDAIAQTDDAINYLRNHATEHPFFMMLSWGPPHNPYHTAPETYRAWYQPDSLTLRDNVPADFQEEAREILAGFYAHCSALDACIGRLTTALETLGLAENTILIFTSDHGDHLGSHYLLDKQSPLDESLRIPFLMRWPDKLKPGNNATVFSVLDVFPTLCGLVNSGPPEALQGRDFSLQFLHGEAPPEDQNMGFCANYHVFGNWPMQHLKKPVPEHLRAREFRGLRTPRYTYCEDLHGPWLLFDNQEDPCQLNNLINQPGHRVLQAELSENLRQCLRHYGDEFKPGMDYVRDWGYQVNESGTIDFHS